VSNSLAATNNLTTDPTQKNRRTLYKHIRILRHKRIYTMARQQTQHTKKNRLSPHEDSYGRHLCPLYATNDKPLIITILATLWACALLCVRGSKLTAFGCKSDGGFVLLQDGVTALMHASMGGHSGVAQMLLLAGVNREVADKVSCRGACHTLGLRAVVCS
jgi:hypothetical protein